MANYWHARYIEAVSKVDEAKTLEARLAYRELAEHYKAMHQFCERPLALQAMRSAA